MISLQKTPKQLKEFFLDNNPQYKEIKDSNPSTGEFHTIGEDDEVWIMQCPKGTDVSALTSQKIKLPGRSNQNELETVAVEYPQPLPCTFGHKNRKGHNSIKIVPIQGSIILRSRLKTMPPPDETQSEAQSGRVPMPAGIKERHPLHGIDYVKKLEISSEVADRLRHADEVSVRTTPKTKSKEPSSILVDSSDGDVELVTQKKYKKKKRKHSNEDEAIAILSPEKKKKKKSLSDDVAEDLKWIQKL